MARGGLAGTEIGFSSINNKIDSMTPGEKEIGPTYGLFTLYEPSESTVLEMDIVLVHGLQGHAMGTWATPKLYWPLDLLPKDLPAARIMTFEYDTLMLDEPPLQIRDLANMLLESLTINRRLSRAGSRPLIFVAHSLGGLLVKGAFLYSQDRKLRDKDSFLVSVATKACIFFGTPHVKTSKASWTQDEMADLQSSDCTRSVNTAAPYKDAHVRGSRRHAQIVSRLLFTFWSDEACLHL